MKKRSKKYSPKKVVLNPIQAIFGGLKKPEKEGITNLEIKHSFAMSNLMSGKGDAEDFNVLRNAVNVALVSHEMFFDHDETRQELINARDSLKLIGERFLKIQKFVLKGDEIKCLNAAIKIQEAMLNEMRIVDYERAVDECERRIKYRINSIKIGKDEIKNEAKTNKNDAVDCAA